MQAYLIFGGSASQLAMILASLPDGVAVDAAPSIPAMPSPVAGSPMMPQGQAQPMPMPTGQPATGDDEADDNGPVNANAPAVDSTGLPWDERIHAKTKTTKADGSWTGRRGGPKGGELEAIVAELRSRVAQPMPQQQQQQQPMMQPTPMPTMPMQQPMPSPNPSPIPVGAPMPQGMPAPVGTEYGAGGVAPAYSPPPMPEQAMQPQQMAQPMPQMQPAPVMQQPMQQPQQMQQPVAADPNAMNTAVAQASGTLDFAQFMQHLSGQMTKRDGAGAPLVHADYLAGITAEISGAFQQPLTAITDIAANPQMINYAMQCMQRDGRW